MILAWRGLKNSPISAVYRHKYYFLIVAIVRGCLNFFSSKPSISNLYFLNKRKGSRYCLLMPPLDNSLTYI